MISSADVRAIREKMNLNVQQFSMKTDFTPQHIYHLENGKTAITAQSEKVILFAFCRWSGASKFGVSRDIESSIRQGLENLMASQSKS